MNIEERLLKIVRQHFNKKKVTDINLNLQFKKDLGLDSLSLTELLIACDEEFGIDINLDEYPEIAEIKTLQSLHDALGKILNQNEST